MSMIPSLCLVAAVTVAGGPRDPDGPRSPLEAPQPAADPPEMTSHVSILDRTDRSAVVRIHAPRWIDFPQLARFQDGWKIVNVLWETR